MHFPEFVLFCSCFGSLRGEGSFIVNAHQWKDATQHSHFVWMFFKQLIDHFCKQSASDILIITVFCDRNDWFLRAAHVIRCALRREKRGGFWTWCGFGENDCTSRRGRNN